MSLVNDKCEIPKFMYKFELEKRKNKRRALYEAARQSQSGVHCVVTGAKRCKGIYVCG